MPRLQKHSLRSFFFLMGSVLFSLCSSGQTAADIIAKYISFIGGEKAWSEVTSVVSSGEYNYGGVAFPFKSCSKAPDRYKFVVTFKGKYYAQAFDGEAGWKIDVFNGETKPTTLTGNAARAMANESDVETENVFVNYEGKGHRVTLEGQDSVGGKACYKIKLVKKNGETETCYFDETTGALVMKKAVAKNPELGGALLSIFYSDYREVGGIKLPFKTIARTDDQVLLTISVASVQINVPIADSAFQFNAAGN